MERLYRSLNMRATKLAGSSLAGSGFAMETVWSIRCFDRDGAEVFVAGKIGCCRRRSGPRVCNLKGRKVYALVSI